LLKAAALCACGSCTCLAAASQDCCTLAGAPPDAVRIDSGVVTIDLARTPDLARAGDAIKVVDSARKLQILVARTAKGEFVALDQRCTHGGGNLTYVHRHKHLYCTCWGHAIFALDGSVIRWPNTQTPRPLRAHAVERQGSHLAIRVEGLA
jgi:nitrite reductase/ring-hydroxylating ferredoxin subunit